MLEPQLWAYFNVLPLHSSASGKFRATLRYLFQVILHLMKAIYSWSVLNWGMRSGSPTTRDMVYQQRASNQLERSGEVR